MIDKNKQYTTRNGLPVRIYATDAGGHYPVHGAVFDSGVWYFHCWTTEGILIAGELNGYDLIEVKPRIQRTVWLNVYDDFFNSHASREEADRRAMSDRIACIQFEIDCEEGEGL